MIAVAALVLACAVLCVNVVNLILIRRTYLRLRERTTIRVDASGVDPGKLATAIRSRIATGRLR